MQIGQTIRCRDIANMLLTRQRPVTSQIQLCKLQGAAKK